MQRGMECVRYELGDVRKQPNMPADTTESVSRLNGFPFWSDLFHIAVKLGCTGSGGNELSNMRTHGTRDRVCGLGIDVCRCNSHQLQSASERAFRWYLRMQTHHNAPPSYIVLSTHKRYISDLITTWQIFAWVHSKLPKLNWKTFRPNGKRYFSMCNAATDLWQLCAERF